MAWRSFCGDYTFGMAPSLDSSDHQDYYMFSRHSERNLHELHCYSIPGAISKPKTRMGSATSVSRLEILWRSDGRLWSNGLWISNQVEKFMMLYHWFISQQFCMCTAVINIYIYIRTRILWKSKVIPSIWKSAWKDVSLKFLDRQVFEGKSFGKQWLQDWSRCGKS